MTGLLVRLAVDGSLGSGEANGSAQYSSADSVGSSVGLNERYYEHPWLKALVFSSRSKLV